MRKKRKSPKRLTSKQRAQVVADRGRGLTIAEIASRHGISVGTVHRLVATQTTGATQTISELQALDEIPTSSMSASQLRAWLTAQILEMQALVADARARGDGPIADAAARRLVAMAGHLARLTPAEPAEQPAGHWVTAEEMDQAAARVRRRWHDLADQLVETAANPSPGLLRLLADVIRNQ